MTQFIQTAALHPATVTRLSMGEVAPVRRTRARHDPRNGVMATITVDPRIWAVALQQAEGVPGRIQVVHETCVIVHNSPLWRYRKA